MANYFLNPWDDYELESGDMFPDLHLDLLSPTDLGEAQPLPKQNAATMLGPVDDANNHSGENTVPPVYCNKKLSDSSSDSGAQSLSSKTQQTSNKVGNESPSTKSIRKKKAAEFSKTSREKRKREVQYLKARNKQLLIERETFLEKVARLQGDAQAFRCQNQIDLERENVLLRAEVEQHKRFVKNLQQFIKDQEVLSSDQVDTDISQELEQTKQELLRNAASSGAEQVVGLCMTTSVNPYMRAVKLSDDMAHIKVYFQNLPFGSSANTCKRILVRTEAEFEIPFKKCMKVLPRMFVHTELMQKKYQDAFHPAKLLSVDSIGTLKENHGLQHSTKCSAVTHTFELNNQTGQLIFVSTEQQRDVPLRSTRREETNDNNCELDKTQPAYIFSQIFDDSLNINQMFGGQVPNCLVQPRGTSVTGYLCCATKTGGTRMVCVHNSRRVALALPGEEDESAVWFNDDDTPSEKVDGLLRHALIFDLEYQLAAMNLSND